MKSGFEVVKLGEVVEITSSKRIFMSEYVASGVPFYRGKEIIEKFKGKEKITTELFISNDKYLEIKEKFDIPREKDILLTSVGTLGIPWMVDTNEPFYFKDGNLTWIRRYSEKILPEYLYYWIISPKGYNSLLSSSIGSTQQALTIQNLRNIEIPLPSIESQKEIVEQMSTIDEKISVNRKIVFNLEETARLLFKHWFIDFEFLDENGNPFKSSGGEMAECELGFIPTNWTVANIGQIAQVIDCLHTKKPERCAEGKPMLQLWNITTDNFINMDDTYHINDDDYKMWTKRIEVGEGDCVITNVGRSGAVGRIPCGLTAAMGRNMTAIRCRDNFAHQFFLIYCLTSEFMQKEIQSSLDYGTILNALNVKNIPLLKFVLPETKVIEQFEMIVRPMRLLSEEKNNEISKLISIRNTILPKVISGEKEI